MRLIGILAFTNSSGLMVDRKSLTALRGVGPEFVLEAGVSKAGCWQIGV